MTEEEIKAFEIEMEEKRLKEEKTVNAVKDFFNSLGVKINIEGCGCCGSAVVKIIYNDKTILEETENFNITMIE